jgi:hypothetical protein
MFPLATAGSGESDFRTSRLAPELTVVVAVAELFPATGSSADVTLAVFVMIVPFGVAAFTFTTSVKDPLPSAGSVAMLQFTVPVPPPPGVVQVHPAGDVIEKNVALAGRVSERATVVPAAAVRLVTAIV